MSSNFTIKGIDKFINALKEKQEKIETNVGQGLATACNLVQRTAQESMTNTKINTGVSYYTHNKRIPHHPSFPDNPPAVDTGTLRRSVTTQVDESTLTGKVGSNIEYAPELEFGSSRIAPRPWLRPALEQNEKNIEKILAQAVARGVNV